MYTEYSDEEERKGFPIRDFLIKLVLVIVAIFLLMWLLPTKNVNLDGITDKIFNANLQTMKEAAIPYFTTERLPKNVGDKVTLTLEDMINKKLVLPITDKNGDACDVKRSYVSLEKKDSEYLMTVNLKCGEEEDYIRVYLGCYSYCESDVCEKQVDDTVASDKTPTTNSGSGGIKNPTTITDTVVGGPSCSLEIVSGNKGSNNWYLGNVVVGFRNKSTSTSGAKITSYGLTTSSNVTYNKLTKYTVNKDGSTKVYGFVKDSKGKTAICTITVNRDTVDPSCNVGVLSGVKNSSGVYVTDVTVGFTSRTDKTSGVDRYGMATSSTPNYNSKSSLKVTSDGTKTVYGYVKDKAGHARVCSVKISVKKASDQSKVSIPSCSLSVSGSKGMNDWYVGNATVSFSSKSSTDGAKITSYGIGTSENYNGQNSYVVNKDGSYTIFGYVKDSNGYTATCSKTLKRDATKPNCSLAVQSGTYNSAGYYTSNVVVGFKTRSDATSGVGSYGIGKSLEYNSNTTYTVNSDGTHTVYGYLRDNAGNTNTCSIKVEKKSLSYEWQYKKHIEKGYTAWSDWTTKEYTLNAKPTFKKTDTEEVEDLGGTKVQDGYEYQVGDPITVKDREYYTTITETRCSGYNYYRVSGSTSTYAVKANDDNWKYVGIVSVSSPPSNTFSTKYEFVGLDWDRCGNSCLYTPYTRWKKYTRTTASVSGSGANSTITTNGVKVTCANTTKVSTKLYLDVTTVVGYNKTRTIKYKTVYKYRYRNRRISTEAHDEFKWSTYNNKTLIDDGWSMTGNKRIAS